MPVDAAKAHHVLEVLVDVRAVRVEVLAVRLVAGPAVRLADEVDHVKAEAAYALALPKAQDVGHLLANLGVVPVEVRLGHVKEVQVPLVERGDVLPGVAAKLALPVGGRLAGIVCRGVRRCIHKLVVGLVVLVAGEGALEPLVLGGGVVEHHVQHELDATGPCLVRELLEVGHGAKQGLDGAVVCHVVTVVVLGTHEEGRDPQHVNAQLSQVVQLGGDAAQVTDAVAVRVAERANVNLIDDLASEFVRTRIHDGSFGGLRT